MNLNLKKPPLDDHPHNYQAVGYGAEAPSTIKMFFKWLANNIQW